MRFLLVLSLLPCAASAQETTPEQDWASRDDFVVVQRLPYERSGRMTLAPFLAIIPNDPFTAYLPVGLRFGYFLNESFHTEFSASYMDLLTVDRDLRKRVGRSDEEQSAVKLQDHQVARAQWSASWTLVSAKARWWDGQTVYLRGHVLGGFGAILARNAADELDPRAEGLFGLGFEAHVADSGSIRLEGRQGIFQREAGGALLPTEISLGYAFYFGGPLGGVR